MIIDDEEHCIIKLKEYLDNKPYINLISAVSDPEKALGQILDIKPDLIFLDIQMPGKSGFEILQALEKTSVKPLVIFVTAFNDYVIQAIRAAAFDYLLKPVDLTELAVAVERAINKINLKKEESSYACLLELYSDKKIRFNSTGGFIMMDPKEIIFVQADWNYSEIHTNRNKFELVTMNLGSIEQLLPSIDFVRINRSVIVNLKYLVRVQRLKRICILKNDNDIFAFKIPLRRIRELEERL